MPSERRLAAILSADVAGYSRLMAEDEPGTIQTVTAYREAITTLVEQHHGRVVDSPGDNLLAEFPNALDAVQCAVEIQGVLRVRNQSLAENRQMLFRIGVHLGDIMTEGERIYGDGVNIAARLEGLAESGGVCISGTVYDVTHNRLNVGLEDLGEQEFKNIPKPVRVYHVRSSPAERAGTDEAEPEFTVPGFGGRPAIAVLPFDNLSGDPDQEYFADGISEDLITRLSMWRSFPVIARNSSFVYKGDPVDIKQVSGELGARYVVEGSVRRAGGRVRISAQLIDAMTGHHVWADQYDRELADVFSLQDQITEAIVAAIYPQLLQAEQERASRQEPSSLDAWELFQRGMWHAYHTSGKEENATALSLFQQAQQLDPSLAAGFCGEAQARFYEVLFQWTDSPVEAARAALEAAQKALALDSQYPFAHIALAMGLILNGDLDGTLAAYDRALELDPSLAVAHYQRAQALGFAGRTDEAISSVQKFFRLSPRDPHRYVGVHVIARVQLTTGRYAEAVASVEQAHRLAPPTSTSLCMLAASLAHLGRVEDAHTALDEMYRIQPDFKLETLRVFYSTAPEALERFIDGLRKAGLRE